MFNSKTLQLVKRLIVNFMMVVELVTRSRTASSCRSKDPSLDPFSESQSRIVVSFDPVQIRLKKSM